MQQTNSLKEEVNISLGSFIGVLLDHLSRNRILFFGGFVCAPILFSLIQAAFLSPPLMA
jgi:hypothetical protein